MHKKNNKIRVSNESVRFVKTQIRKLFWWKKKNVSKVPGEGSYQVMNMSIEYSYCKNLAKRCTHEWTPRRQRNEKILVDRAGEGKKFFIRQFKKQCRPKCFR